MRKNAPTPQDDSALWQEILEIAQAIEKWSLRQRKDYLFNLTKREFDEGKTWRRTLVKLMIVNDEKRQRFIRLAKEGKIDEFI